MFNQEKIIFEGAGEFGHYQIIDMVYEGRQARVLFSGDRTAQSGAAQDDNPELLFDYNQRFLEIAESIRPKSALIIGGGAFMLPKALLERSPNTQIDVVEIDPLLEELSRRYFDLPKSNRLTVHCQDGRKFIETTKNRYDFIVVDAFSEYTIPVSLLTKEAARTYREHLNENGMVAVNLIAAYHSRKPTLAHNLKASFKESFERVDIYPASTGLMLFKQNLVLTAYNSIVAGLDYLQSAALASKDEPGGVPMSDKDQ